MSESNALLVGGTKVLERELQNHLSMPLLSVATIEDAAKIIQERQPKLIVLGPTLRRALATVTTLRREGQTEPRLMVVYRDDQRDEVKRHQKGKQVADSYIVQSRIQKEVGPAIGQLLGLSGESALEEIPADALSASDEFSAADEAPQLPPTGTTGPNDVLGSYGDAARRAEQLQTETLEADALELLEELPMMEDELLEELDEGDLSMEDMSVEEMTLEELPALSEELGGNGGDNDLLASDLLEEMVEDLDGDVEELQLDGADLEETAGPEAAVQPVAAAPAAAPAANVQGPDQEVELDSVELDSVELDSVELDSVELDSVELDSADLQSADGDTSDLDSADFDSLEPVEEVVTADLIEEVSASAEPIEDLDLAELIEDMESEPQAEATAEFQEAPQPQVAEAEPVAAAAVAPAAVEPAAVAVAAPPAAAAAVQVESASAARRQPSGAQAMFTELTSFVERLQDSAASIARLEAENEKLREELDQAKRAAQPERQEELLALRQNLGDLQVRLAGAEQARDAAVEARMRGDLLQADHADELAKLRAELASARHEVATQSQQLSSLNQQLVGQEQQLAAQRGDLGIAATTLANLESQLDARRRISADSAKSLRAIATMLEG